MTAGGAAREAVASLGRVDRAGIVLPEAGFVVVVAAVGAWACLAADRAHDAALVGVGCLFAAIVDVACGRVRRRARAAAVLVAAIAMTATTAIGIALAGSPVPRIAWCALVALGAGLVTAYGKVPATIGLLCAVLATVATGSPGLAPTLAGSSLALLAGSCTALALPLLVPRGDAPLRISGPPARALLGEPSLARRHAARYATAIAVAAAYAALDTSVHAYWVPLTVAWILKPDAATTTRVAAHRLVGTAAGVLIVVALGDGLGLEGLALGVASAVMGGLCLAFLGAHYATATAGITGLVVGMFAVAGAPLGGTLDERAVDTLAGAAIVAVTLLAWRDRAGEPGLAPGPREPGR